MTLTISPQLHTLINSALAAIDPYNLTFQHLKKTLPANKLSHFKNIYVIGFGKAGYKMALAAEAILKKRITAGFINVPQLPTLNKLCYLKLQETSHPLPQTKNVSASKKIAALAKSAKENDLVICLISGGGSALLTLPAPPLKLTDIKLTSALLIKYSSASIEEINIVRKHLSQVKGGRLAALCYPATVYSFVISDLTNNNLTTIASGPTYPDNSTFAQAWQIIKKYKLTNKLPGAVKNYLKQGLANKIAETPKPSSPIFTSGKIKNIIIGDNQTALQAIAKAAKKIKLQPIILPNLLQGEARKCAADFIKLLKIAPENTCLIAGGETVVKVKGNGYGGRNQEFALQVLKKIPKRLLSQIELVSFGSDGIDGFCPKKVAGAWINYPAYQKMKQLKLKPTLFQKNNDSYTFFNKIKTQLITGPTGTNVGDIVITIKHANETGK